ncbi:MAG: phenylacetate-CoA oxygenase subunit PaaC [Anaerolineae bacterium]|nr:phenylacetate-CoA oxygenase subunit PaaC [Anaerolineae bacterium]
MTPLHPTALAQKLLFLADDELILAHRNSEWTGHGPILEEDIAFTNIALDEMGHAATWHRLRQELTGEEVDTAVFFRDPAAYRNVQLVELPHDDWAFSMLRQYLFDVYEMVHLAQLAASSYRPLAEAAAKIRIEEIYHLRHTAAWVTRLGLGTAESHRRMQAALDTLWPYAQQLFVNMPEDEELGEMGTAVTPTTLHHEWQHLTTTHLTLANLTIPTDHTPPTTNRAHHTHHLTHLLTEMQSVARQYPTAVW